MLICNNCYSENPDGTVRCTQCNMAGNFSHKLPISNGLGILKVDKTGIQCTNCGSHSPGEGRTCIHCHFPMATSKQQNGQALQPGTYHNLKTGS